MANLKNRMSVTAVVPVYNEGKTIGGILKILTTHDKIKNVIVVDDGSTDATPSIIKEYNVKIKTIRKNRGKGNAVRVGAEKINSDVILLVDGDLINLNRGHIDKMIAAMKDDVAMVIGLRDKGNIISDLIMPYFPLTGGERVIKTGVFNEIRKVPLTEGWGLETVMNDYCRKKKLKIAKVKLDGLDHIGLQTKKYGLYSFIKECYDVAKTKIRLWKVRY